MPLRTTYRLTRPGPPARTLLRPRVRYADWRWVKLGDDWLVEVDDDALEALKPRAPEVVSRVECVFTIGQEAQATALWQRAVALCAPKSDAADEHDADGLDDRSLLALLSTEFGAESSHDWQRADDTISIKSRVIVDATWCSADRATQVQTFPVERALSVARMLWRDDRSLACKLLRAFVLEDLPPVSDTDFLIAAHKLEDLDPDLRAMVESVKLGVTHTSALTIREYQRIGAVFALGLGKRALIADAPGVGKSLAAIATLRAGDVRDHTPALIVAPASVLTSWRDEIQRWAPSLHPVVVDGATIAPPIPGRVWIVSWSRLHRVAPTVVRGGCRFFVGDEFHYAKSGSSIRSRAAAYLAAHVPYMLALTGTPIENRVDDLWNVLRMLQPDVWPDREPFVARYGSKRWRPIGQNVIFDEDRDGMLPELRAALKTVMVRRRKTDVLADLPEKTRVAVAVDLPGDARRAYDAAEADMPSVIAASLRRQRAREAVGYVKQGHNVHQVLAHLNAQGVAITATQMQMLALAVMGHLRRFVGQAKIGPAVSWIEDFVPSGESLVVFVAHRVVGDGICAALERRKVRHGRIDGSVSVEDRGALVKAFQAGKIQVLVCGIRAANTGITLTRASHVLIVERDLVPAVEEQAVDRCHRLGQKSAVTAYFLMARNTIDDRLGDIAETKERVAGEVLGAEDVSDAEGEMDGMDARIAASSIGALAVQWFARRVSSIVRGGVDLTITVEDVKAAWSDR